MTGGSWREWLHAVNGIVLSEEQHKVEKQSVRGRQSCTHRWDIHIGMDTVLTSCTPQAADCHSEEAWGGWG